MAIDSAHALAEHSGGPAQSIDPGGRCRRDALRGALVAARRGARLAQGLDLFTGDVWTGAQAVEVGLADGIAHLEPKLRQLYGDKVRLRPYGARKPFLRRLGMSADDLVGAAHDRLMWPGAGA